MSFKEKLSNFWAKTKHFFGAHGLVVEHTQIEKQEPATVKLPIGDTVVKGHFDIYSEKSNEVLSWCADFYMEIPGEEGVTKTVLLGRDFCPDPNCDRSDPEFQQYPFSIDENEVVNDSFIISMEVDIPTALQNNQTHFDDANFFVKTTVDVKGSPYDPETITKVKVLS